MKNILLLLFFGSTLCKASGQQIDPDSLKQVFRNSQKDSIRFALSLQIGEKYYYKNTDSALAYIRKAMALADKSKSELLQAHIRVAMLQYYFVTNDLVATLNSSLQNINDYSRYRDPYILALSIHVTAALYSANGYHEKAIIYEQNVITLLDTLHFTNSLYRVHFFNTKEKLLAAAYMVLGSSYMLLQKMDSSLWAARKAYETNMNGHTNWNYPVHALAVTYETMGQRDTALALYKTAASMAINEVILYDVADSYNRIAILYRQRNQIDSAIAYAQKVISLEKQIKQRVGVESALYLSEMYENQHRSDSALYFYKYAMGTKDSLSNLRKIQQVQSFAFREEMRERGQREKALLEQTQYRNRVKVFSVLGVAMILLSITFFLWRNNRHKQKANVLLQQKNTQIEQTLAKLKSTQAQLIQSEKMASLGELTAGIAHEIQNPLNFVNNFSDVNKELADELKAELATGNMQLANEIADDIKDNSEKINHHGKRADAIVKGMLQHSRSSNGVKEPTDINALADEYLRLSYHGLRAKDKSFNATIKTDFDVSIGNINIIPQDIGRVILNLITNAFYAVTEKKKHASASLPAGQAGLAGQPYEPTVSVSTKKINGRVEIKVRDNGNGILQKVVDKIFQPFFTTKPTGQGTGLGLSLSYDIIKAHGGELKVETKENEFAEFVITLPE